MINMQCIDVSFYFSAGLYIKLLHSGRSYATIIRSPKLGQTHLFIY